MGIRNLNKFFRNEAIDSIKLISLSQISGKKLAVDISIYIYKYVAEESLIENIYLMLSIFNHYNIIPIFIFDGKPPAEKKELLIQRRKDKNEAENQYNKLKEQINSKLYVDEIDKQEIIASIDMLKKSFININKKHIEDVKNLIRAFGVTYYDAPGEADELCALLAIKGKVWGCLSEDMDMFIYGTPNVIRYFSLLNHTAVLYELNGIREKLGITQKELREICVLSGTDYNIVQHTDKDTPNLHTTLKYFNKFTNENTTEDFYEWLLNNTEYIRNMDLLKKINNMFELDNINHIDNRLIKFDSINIKNSPINKKTIKEILLTNNFIFPL
jgi:flap endonuclease-1